jgi:hypothetical protein
MTREVCLGRKIIQITRYASCTAGIRPSTLHFYLIILEFIIRDNTVNSRQRSRQQIRMLRMSCCNQDGPCFPRRDTCVSDMLSAGA